MAAIERSKVTVVGAGSVGSSIAYAALIRGSARQVVLYDIATEKVDAEVLDLAHGTQFYGASEISGGSDLAAVAGSHVVVVTAGAKQHPGQTRVELAAVNARILRELMPRLLDVAPHAIYVIVSNPCDILTMIAREQTGLPAERILATGTVLDSSRLRWRLSQRAGVSISSVHAHIAGEHGDTEFPLWSTARIGAVPILEWEAPDGGRISPEELDRIAVDVRDAAYTVIRGKGATNYAIGVATARVVEAVLRDDHAILPVSTVLEDFHGVDGVALSVPSVVSARGAVPIRGTSFSASEREQLTRSAEAMRGVADALRLG